jgi:hypothetical protein
MFLCWHWELHREGVSLIAICAFVFISRILTSVLDTAVVNEEPSGVVAVNQIMLEDMRKTNQNISRTFDVKVL